MTPDYEALNARLDALEAANEAQHRASTDETDDDTDPVREWIAEVFRRGTAHSGTRPPVDIPTDRIFPNHRQKDA